MRAINLLPRIPFVQKWLIPLLALIVMATVGGILLLSYAYFHANSAGERSQNQIQSLQTSIANLKKAQQIDATTQDYTRLQQAVSNLQKRRRDWLPVINTITSKMPVATRLYDYDAKEDTIVLKLQSSSIQELAAYMTSLENSGLFKSITVQSIQSMFVKAQYLSNPGGEDLEEDQLAASEDAVSDEEIAQEEASTFRIVSPTPTPIPNAQVSNSSDQQVNQSGTEMESERLLKELDSYMKGNKIVTTSSPTPKPSNGDGFNGQSVISQQEWLEAKQKYEAQQLPKPTPQPAFQTPRSTSTVKPKSSASTEPVQNNGGNLNTPEAVPIIQAQLQLLLQPLKNDQVGAKK
ncbi:PilN domain-containing protein [Paenibacillus cymbidii]|uniref:PilN domain-containing protein n=1 Tax=Paenibacillus cymbidii TaxID=1639034 RepID=UPI00108206C5|nr:hypothetical protein [Paenibacillus cymbidii]